MSVSPLSASTVNSVNTTPSTTSLLSGLTSTSTTTSSQSSTSATSQLGESAFLTLLSAELQYQNPLQPMDNTQFVAELAQFSQLSATTSQTSTLNNILTSLQGNSLVNASQMIGKTVTTSSGTGTVTAVTSTSGGLSYEVKGIGSVTSSDITGISEASS